MEIIGLEEKTEYNKDFELLQSFAKYSNLNSKFFNSTDLRRFVNNEEGVCSTLKTFDKGIRILNEKLSYNTPCKNPIFQKPSEIYATPLHANVFYTRLSSCLNIKLDDGQKSSAEKNSSLLNEQIFSDSFAHTYIFDIHKFYMPPFFTPLFIGIVCSVTKGNISWEKFRKNVLSISESFYYINHKEISSFLPPESEMMDLYEYWLELHFPNELYNFINDLDKAMNSSDRILSYNLNFIADALAKDLFFFRITQKSFLKQFGETLKDYQNTPLVDPTTMKPNNFDLIQGYNEMAALYHNKEFTFVQNIS